MSVLAHADKAAYNVVFICRMFDTQYYINILSCHIWSPAKFGVFVDENREKLHMLYWLH